MDDIVNINTNVEVDIVALLFTAAQSVFGLIALIIIISSVVTCVLFWNSGDRARIIAFILFFIGSSAFGGAVLYEKRTEQAHHKLKTDKIDYSHNDKLIKLEQQKLIAIENERIRAHEIKLAEIGAAIKEKEGALSRLDATIKQKEAELSSNKYDNSVTNNLTLTQDEYGAYAHYLTDDIPPSLVSHGWATSKSSSKEATALALKRCGNKYCRASVTIKNDECASVALNNIAKSKRSRQEAESGACKMSKDRTGKKTCTIHKTICAGDRDTWQS